MSTELVSTGCVIKHSTTGYCGMVIRVKIHSSCPVRRADARDARTARYGYTPNLLLTYWLQPYNIDVLMSSTAINCLDKVHWRGKILSVLLKTHQHADVAQ